MIIKICKNCLKPKKLNQFYMNKHMPDGYVNVCISCKTKAVIKRKYNPSEISILLQRWQTNSNHRVEQGGQKDG